MLYQFVETDPSGRPCNGHMLSPIRPPYSSLADAAIALTQESSLLRIRGEWSAFPPSMQTDFAHSRTRSDGAEDSIMIRHRALWCS